MHDSIPLFRRAALVFSFIMLCFLCACGISAPTLSPAPAEDTPAPTAPPVQLRISEVMSSNHASLAAPDGAFYDWVELYNYGSEPVELDGYRLIVNGRSAKLSGRLESASYAVFFCSASSPKPDILSLSLPNEGCEIQLSYGDSVLHRVTVPALDADCSCYFSTVEPEVSEWPSPGFENTENGYIQFQSTRSSPSLVLNEVMVGGSFCSPDGERSDWIELKNASAESVSLSGWYLSDSTANRYLYALPDVTLQPGEITMVWCSKESTGFGLNTDTDALCLTAPDGSLADYLALHDLPLGRSMGRQSGYGGFFFFDSPTPGADNSIGFRLVSAAPGISCPDGIYEDISSLLLELSSPGTIYYTIDGSLPTEASSIYSSPLTLYSTTVLRLYAQEPGKLPSETLTLSYIINEGHTLPVVSLVVDPEEMFGSNGVYTRPYSRDLSCLGVFTLYDGGERIRMGCTVQMHGQTSRAYPKKGMKLSFSAATGGHLNYPLFDNGITEYSSILLRAAQEGGNLVPNLRDAILHDLAAQCTDALPTQACRYAVLYINGQYWGLYAIREAYSTLSYSQHYSLGEDSVTMMKEAWSALDATRQLGYAIAWGNMRDTESYSAAISHLDVENLAAWCLLEAYGGNTDINPPNIRFFYSTEDEIMRYALVDMDLCLFTFGTFTFPLTTGYIYSSLPTQLLTNPDFRDEFLTYWGQWLSGPLSDSNVEAVVTKYVDQVSPEITRDAARWGYSASDWFNQIPRSLYRMCTNSYQHARALARSAQSYLGFSNEEFDYYFGNVA